MSAVDRTPPSSYKKYSGKGLTGLANLGNTCYINSCVQVLSHTYELNEFLEPGEYKKRLNNNIDAKLLVEWDKLRELMWKENCTIAPMGFLRAVQHVSSVKKRDLFTGNAQNDIQEFLLFVIDCFHSAMSREVDMKITGIIKDNTDILANACYKMIHDVYKNEYSEMITFFYGVHVSEITGILPEGQVDGIGEVKSIKPEPFSVISLPMPPITKSATTAAASPDKPTIYDCFDIYCRKEILEGDNAWLNDKTNKKESVYRRIIFWSLPNILIIDLKRWNNDGRLEKNQKFIDIPLRADFSKYVKGYNPASYVYELYGVCNHSGNSGGGHYTATIKNANGKWYNCNDTHVNEIIDGRTIISDKSYCIFYRKIVT
jgi:ubiquitin C-terminal hydrolase